MSKLLKVLGTIVTWGGSLTVIYLNHVVLNEGGKELDIVGLLTVIVIIFLFIKWVDSRVKVMDIQDKYKIFRLSWNSGKKIVLAILLTWGLYTVEDNLQKLKWTAVLITTCFILGYVLTLFGNLKDNKKVSP